MDSYSMVLFEVICREVPFEDEDPGDVGTFTVRGVRPDLEAVPPDCPESLRRLMIACWNQAPKERPHFQEILKVLQRIGPGDDGSGTLSSRPKSISSKGFLSNA